MEIFSSSWSCGFESQSTSFLDENKCSKSKLKSKLPPFKRQSHIFGPELLFDLLISRVIDKMGG